MARVACLPTYNIRCSCHFPKSQATLNPATAGDNMEMSWEMHSSFTLRCNWWNGHSQTNHMREKKNTHTQTCNQIAQHVRATHSKQ